MAEETDELPEGGSEDSGEESGGGRAKMIAMIVVVLLGLSVGVVVGKSTLGDVVGSRLADRELHGGSGRGGGHGSEGPPPNHVIENLIVNPARSQGTRFLLTSIAIEVVEPELSDFVAEKEYEIRSRLIDVLGTKTTEELTNVALRPAIVTEMHDAIVEIMGPGVVRNVHVFQFVVQ